MGVKKAKKISGSMLIWNTYQIDITFTWSMSFLIMFTISGVHAWTAAVLADETQGAWFLQLPVGEEQWHWQADTARWYALLYASWGLHGNHWTTHEKCKNHKKLSFPFRLNIIVILGILPCYL